jgi:hypothetical protein
MGVIRTPGVCPAASIIHAVVPSARDPACDHEVEVETDVRLRKATGQDDQGPSIVIRRVAQLCARAIEQRVFI